MVTIDRVPHAFQPGRFDPSRCQVQLSRYPCPYTREQHQGAGIDQPAATDAYRPVERFGAEGGRLFPASEQPDDAVRADRERVVALLDGIDRTQDDGGWWETSTGAEHGAAILAAIRAGSVDTHTDTPGEDTRG